MESIDRVQKRGGRAGRRQRRGDLPANESRLPDTHHEDAAAGRADELHRAHEGVVEARFERGQRVALAPEDASPPFQNAVPVAHGATPTDAATDADSATADRATIPST